MTRDAGRDRVRGHGQGRAGVHLLPRQLPMVAWVPAGAGRRAVGRRRDRRDQPRRPGAGGDAEQRRPRVVRGMGAHGGEGGDGRSRARRERQGGECRGVPLPRRPLLSRRRALPRAEDGRRARRLQARRRLLPRWSAPRVPAAHRARRGALRGHEPAGALRSRRGWRAAVAGPRLLRRLRRHEGDPVLQGRPRPRRARHRLPDRRRTRQRRGHPLQEPAAHHETERYATAAYEYLATRPEVDSARVGVMAISLGGYYAPRAAAFESRFAACIAWGAQWDYHAVWKERLDRIARGETPSLSVPWEHLLWIFGVTSRDAALKRLEGFRLDGVVQRIRCPFLLVHGEGDAQIPPATAQKGFGAVGSTRKTFKVFTREEGGYHHCQSDNVSIGTAYMWDWLAGVFAM